MKKYEREYYRLAKEKQRELAIVQLGGACVKCGATSDLQFDHIDPKLKLFNISSRLSLKSPEVQAELAKCQLLCCKCHTKKTIAEHPEFTHGTVYGWMKMKCPCDACRQGWRAYQDLRSEKRREHGAVAGKVRGPYRKTREHGTTTMYRQGCRCSVCRDGHTKIAREQRQAKRARAGMVNEDHSK